MAGLPVTSASVASVQAGPAQQPPAGGVKAPAAAAPDAGAEANHKKEDDRNTVLIQVWRTQYDPATPLCWCSAFDF